MRPLRLTVEGFTSFRERVELDFSDLDLFAITGPTGAGKSSLVDAMVLALYGQVPRVGREYKQLISHGAERLAVRLDFQVAGQEYRVVRTVKGSGTPQTRLEKLVDGEARPIADRVKEIEEQIARILGLDYEAFTRSVVLPQGQFDAFLKGKPEERRKILVALLNLGVYEQMHAIVNRRAADARREAAFIASQLAADFAEATPENLAARGEALERADEQLRAIAGAQAALEQGLELARELRVARRQLTALEADVEAESARRAQALAAAAAAEAEHQGLRKRQAELERRMAAAGPDEARQAALLEARPRAEQLRELAAKLLRLDTEASSERQALEKASGERARAEGLLPALETRADGARAEVEAARERLDELGRRHAAHELRRHLRPGEACPVCEQTVTRVPGGAATGFEAARHALAAAETEAEKTRASRDEARLRAERLRGAERIAQMRVRGLEAQRMETAATLQAVKDALEQAGFRAHEVADPGALLGRIRHDLGALAEARRAREALEGERKRLDEQALALEAKAAGARAQAEAATARLTELELRRQTTGGGFAHVREALANRARSEGWGLDPLPADRDEVDFLEALRSARQRETTDLSAVRERLRTEAASLERAMARAAELSGKRKALEACAALAGTLAQHLQANQFIAYVQEEALRRLAGDGTRHLLKLSQGRYSLACEEQEFSVVDHWNAGRKRSVKTLSGGESFLASLALALALAESLASLSAEGRAGDALESLFLDEGFGTLDPETLGLVVQAIEALQGGSRLVGVVTHIPELAERLPARVEVGGSGGTATLTVA